jgi:hypothetical protein
VYYGFWDNDMRMGLGCHMWPDGSKYEGEWAQGVQQGRGRYVWADGAFLPAPPAHPLACNRLSHGAGSGHTAQRRGLGALAACTGLRSPPWLCIRTRSVGRKYEGDFLKGRRTGEGIATSANGRKFKGGIWENGTLLKESKLILERNHSTKAMYPSASLLALPMPVAGVGGTDPPHPLLQLATWATT